MAKAKAQKLKSGGIGIATGRLLKTTRAFRRHFEPDFLDFEVHVCLLVPFFGAPQRSLAAFRSISEPMGFFGTSLNLLEAHPGLLEPRGSSRVILSLLNTFGPC